jgi:phosphonopyruvate decarboxylase
VGGMGHASQIAFGLALQSKRKNIICIDGDGAAIMHLGSMAINGQFAPKNFKHILLNNGAHDSVGGQPTVGFDICFSDLAKSFGYNLISTKIDGSIPSYINDLIDMDGPAFIEIKTNRGSRSDLGRPTKTPLENKNLFMKNSLNR